ncbi:diguanylate cyclase [Aeromonas taiwanensis]|uniref:diguanylate cyclase n=1 Tax=Aeromonas taiwanensis TaxID=633417 RepID=UPI003B9E61E1
MIIDIPTMFMMIIAASVTLTCSVGWVTRAKDEKELQLWTLGLALQTLVFTLFFLRNQIHDFFSVLVANAALSASLSCFLAAVVVFQQRRLSRLWFYAPPLLLATTFSFFMDDIGARIMICGAICSVQCLVVLITLLDRRVVVSGRGKYLIASGLSLSIAVLTLRFFSVMFYPDDISSLLRETPIQVVTFLATFITLLLMSNGFVLMIKESTDEQNRQLAMKDRLTGIWNRGHIEETAKQEMARLERYGHPVSLIMMDIDYFKQINDKLGHGAGDIALKEFCAVVQSCIRTTDLLGRWGGEEFLLLLPNSGFANAAPLAERIRSAIEQYPFSNGLQITASFGLAVCQSTDSWDTWLERTDQALYRAKAAGRNRVENESLHHEPGQTSSPLPNLVHLVWRSTYESGITLIDNQHRSLFEKTNTLLQALLESQPKPEIARLIAQLVADIEQHFHDEEALFQQEGYVEGSAHGLIHAQLVARSYRLLERFEHDQVNAGELLHFLAYEVVAQHILLEDRQYFTSLKRLAIA